MEAVHFKTQVTAFLSWLNTSKYKIWAPNLIVDSHDYKPEDILEIIFRTLLFFIHAHISIHGKVIIKNEQQWSYSFLNGN